MLQNRHVLVTGANGFIGKNLIVWLQHVGNFSVSTLVRSDSVACLPELMSKVDAVIHLAGENRPADEASFRQVNLELTLKLCDAIRQAIQTEDRHIPLVFLSSTQAECDNSYGRSKLAAERAIQELAKETGNPCIILRLPGVFGKWCKPNYNSVVATFCHNVARDLPIRIDDPTARIRLVYVDDVVTTLLAALGASESGCTYMQVAPEYTVTLAELVDLIRSFRRSHSTLMTERVGTGFVRALYATYVSNLPPEKFSYPLPQNVDTRGVFVEMLRTPDSGQISYFTAHPGITRGGHYHHTKTEKFLVVRGEALFRFRHLLTNELVELRTSGRTARVVDTIPGWSHDITNIGCDELVVMLWASENFDSQRPDTVISEVQK
jgi:UDP-2-acetamido-2,6-beta-L-arabino-hexul-4-ose reductase